MPRDIPLWPLDRATFEPFGDVIEIAGEPDRVINQGRCGRWHDLARLDFDDNGKPGISVFRSEPVTLPYTLDMVERHPLGSQTFLPLSNDPFMIIVADDDDGVPARPQAFISTGRQGVNYRRGIWHGVLTPLNQVGLFAVVDRIGGGDNLQEHWFDEPFRIIEAL